MYTLIPTDLALAQDSWCQPPYDAYRRSNLDVWICLHFLSLTTGGRAANLRRFCVDFAKILRDLADWAGSGEIGRARLGGRIWARSGGREWARLGGRVWACGFGREWARSGENRAGSGGRDSAGGFGRIRARLARSGWTGNAFSQQVSHTAALP